MIQEHDFRIPFPPGDYDRIGGLEIVSMDATKVELGYVTLTMKIQLLEKPPLCGVPE